MYFKSILVLFPLDCTQSITVVKIMSWLLCLFFFPRIHGGICSVSECFKLYSALISLHHQGNSEYGFIVRNLKTALLLELFVMIDKQI